MQWRVISGGETGEESGEECLIMGGRLDHFSIAISVPETPTSTTTSTTHEWLRARYGEERGVQLGYRASGGDTESIRPTHDASISQSGEAVGENERFQKRGM